ncbi:MAG TPA: NAD(P)/FAD-dependent oxidoreductase [Steroidobacteraceae bacterium]|nr:NAD(P)/FAD-dependent oxidoreductase [Steroidobacteraceae bacterium]
MSTPAGASRYDCIVIGGGHNGLVCAAYLARGGRKVLVLEAASTVGGAAVTREFAPGFQVSAAAHLLHSMSASIIEDLQLSSHGLSMVASQMPTTALGDDGTALTIRAGRLESGAGAGCASADIEAYPGYAALMDRLADALHPVLGTVPPRLGTDRWVDRRTLMQLGWRIRRLGRHDMRELLRIGGMAVHDLLKDHFQTPLLQGALGFDAVLGTNFGPRSPGSVFTLLYRLAGAAGARSKGSGSDTLMQPRGGLGALTAALAKSAQAAGAGIRTGSPVQSIVVRDYRAAGVVLESGETISADAVISNADPQTTFLRLLGAEHLDAGFVRRVAHLRNRGLAAKLHLALSDLPKFTGVKPEALAGRVLITPTLEYLERAFNHSKYGEYSSAPALEITVPTVNDPTLAPAGRHVLSAVVQYAPYGLAAGWDSGRQSLTALVLQMLERYAPGIGATVTASQLLAPPDIEREFRITGGHWHHAELALDQFFLVRPVPGAAQYAAPLEGLYLCGAGCHPGGGVMGAAGRNAARQVLERAA